MSGKKGDEAPEFEVFPEPLFVDKPSYIYDVIFEEGGGGAALFV